MKKLKRTKKEYGGGTGRQIFESDLFRVVIWSCAKGNKTSLSIKNTNIDMDFDGIHRELCSDEACLKQLTVGDFKILLKCIEIKGFRRGEEHKMNELRRWLGIYP